jgi:signal recognition particle receptor subunit beta
MKDINLKAAQQDIEDALSAVENIEEILKAEIPSRDSIKEKFVFLSGKVQQLEDILKEEGILD